MAHPVAYSIGTKLIDIGDGRIDVPALFLLIHPGIDPENNTYGKKIIHLTELNTFCLHLVPDGIDRLYARTHLILDIHLIERPDNRHGKMFVNLISLRGGLFNFVGEISKYLRMFIFETEF